MKKFRNKYRGFSLIEVIIGSLLLVLVFINISIIVYSGYPYFKKKEDLIFARFELLNFDKNIRKYLYENNFVYSDFNLVSKNDEKILKNNHFKIKFDIKNNKVEIYKINGVNRDETIKKIKFDYLNLTDMEISVKRDYYNYIQVIIFSFGNFGEEKKNMDIVVNIHKIFNRESNNK